MAIRYARVSNSDQSLGLQVDALRLAGCANVCEEVAGGARAGGWGSFVMPTYGLAHEPGQVMVLDDAPR